MVAQEVEVVSRKAGSEEAWCWRSDGKGEFAIEEGRKIRARHRCNRLPQTRRG
jgi:HSP90 family molecular chaperone